MTFTQRGPEGSGLREVLVLAHDDDGALPEVLGLVLVVSQQPLEDVVALADGGQRPRRVVRVGADQQVDAGAPYLLPLAELVELGAWRLAEEKETATRKLRMVLPFIGVPRSDQPPPLRA